MGRRALGFLASQRYWGKFESRERVPQLLRELLLAAADNSLDAYRRQHGLAKRAEGVGEGHVARVVARAACRVDAARGIGGVGGSCVAF